MAVGLTARSAVLSPPAGSHFQDMDAPLACDPERSGLLWPVASYPISWAIVHAAILPGRQRLVLPPLVEGQPDLLAVFPAPLSQQHRTWLCV